MLKQLAKYAVVGALATLLDFSLLIGLTRAGLPYLFSGFVGFTAGLLLNYWLSVKYVFKIRRFSSRTLEFVVFAFIGIVGLLLNELLLWLFEEVLLFGYITGKIVSVIVVFFWNFFMRKYLAFRG